MKYLKKYNESIFSYEYEKISYAQVIEYLSTLRKDDFNNLEIEKMKKVLIDKGLKVDFKNFIYHENTNKEVTISFKEKRKLMICDILKTDDEWYICIVEPQNGFTSDSKYYKCDQFQGLLNFLKEKI